MLALPPAGRNRPRNLMNIGVLLLVCGGLMLFGALIAAYAHVSHLNKPWPPHGVSIDNYFGNMLSITAIMSAITVEWAVFAIKRGERRQTYAALGLTIGFAFAFMNLLWFQGRKAGFGPGASPFSVLFFAMIGAAGAVALIGMAGMLVSLARMISGQLTAANHELLRVVAWYWDFVVFAWLLVYFTVWVFTSR